jgi:hypothetical protein
MSDRERLAPYPQFCTARIFPSWANQWIKCPSAVHGQTGKCHQYDHQTDPITEEEKVDPIHTAEQFAEQAEATERHRAEHAEQARQVAELRAAQARFAHHAPTGAAVVAAHEQARAHGAEFATWLLSFVPPCPSRDRALDAIDLATMHANAAIARTQLEGAWHRVESATPSVDNPMP